MYLHVIELFQNLCLPITSGKGTLLGTLRDRPLIYLGTDPKGQLFSIDRGNMEIPSFLIQVFHQLDELPIFKNIEIIGFYIIGFHG
jgi:hypothetical protein